MKECFPGDVSAEDVACRLDILGMQEFVLPSNTSFGQSEVTLLYHVHLGADDCVAKSMWGNDGKLTGKGVVTRSRFFKTPLFSARGKGSSWESVRRRVSASDLKRVP
jgi:hypothetical protein